MKVEDFVVGKRYLVKHAGFAEPGSEKYRTAHHAFTIEVLKPLPGFTRERLYDGRSLRQPNQDDNIGSTTHLRVVRVSSPKSFMIAVNSIINAVSL
jgi:hypothetical protein